LSESLSLCVSCGGVRGTKISATDSSEASTAPRSRPLGADFHPNPATMAFSLVVAQTAAIATSTNLQTRCLVLFGIGFVMVDPTRFKLLLFVFDFVVFEQDPKSVSLVAGGLAMGLVANCQLRIANCELRVASCKLQLLTGSCYYYERLLIQGKAFVFFK
jgi:hypothetical protein